MGSQTRRQRWNYFSRLKTLAVSRSSLRELPGPENLRWSHPARCIWYSQTLSSQLWLLVIFSMDRALLPATQIYLLTKQANLKTHSLKYEKVTDEIVPIWELRAGAFFLYGCQWVTDSMRIKHPPLALLLRELPNRILRAAPLCTALPLSIAGVGNPWHACQTWHADDLFLARNSTGYRNSSRKVYIYLAVQHMSFAKWE